MLTNKCNHLQFYVDSYISYGWLQASESFQQYITTGH